MMPSRQPPHHLTLVGARRPRAAAPDVASLRRAQQLRSFADRIDRALVVPLAEHGDTYWAGERARLARRMLRRNLVQLRRAAADLRAEADRISHGEPGPAA